MVKIPLPRLPTSLWARVYLAVVLLQVFVTIAIEIVLVVKLRDLIEPDVERQSATTVYDSLFIFAQLYLVIIAWESLLTKNTIQIIATTVFAGACLGYAIIQLVTAIWNPLSRSSPSQPILEDTKILQIAVIIIVGFSLVVYSGLTWQLYQEFGWKIYRKLGANVELRKMYRNYQVLLTLLKLDIFFFIGYSVQLIILVLRDQDKEAYVQIGVVIPFSVVLLGLAFYSLHREHRWFMLFVIAVLSCSPIYFLYRLVTMYNSKWFNAAQKDKYVNSRYYLTFFLVVTLALIFVTIGFSWLCYRAFGKGLQQAIEQYEEKKRRAVEMAKIRRHELQTNAHAMDELSRSNAVITAAAGTRGGMASGKAKILMDDGDSIDGRFIQEERWQLD